MAKFTSWFRQQANSLTNGLKNKPSSQPDRSVEQNSESMTKDALPTELVGAGKNHEDLQDSQLIAQKVSPPAHWVEEEPTKSTTKSSATIGGKTKQFLGEAQKVSVKVLDKLPGKGKPLYRRYWFWTTLGVSSGIIAVSYGVWSIDKTLPSRGQLNAASRQQTLTIKAGDGTILYQQGEATREKLEIGQIPDKLQKAFIASEDRRFKQHGGIDAQGILRAVTSNLRSQDVVQGGSTITQQLARILFLNRNKTVTRKLQEVRLAQKLEQELTKDQILERYLNLIYLGSGAYGVADAAWVYFSKPLDKLSLGEMATIAGLAPAPNVFSPVENPEAAKKRRNLVLQRMLEDGFITPAEKQQAASEPLTVKASLPKRLNIEAPYFITFIQKELPKYVEKDVLEGGGLVVETTLNSTWQKKAEAAVDKTLQNEGRWQRFKQAAMVAIDPRNGEIKAMVGGKDFGQNKFNRVTQAQRQPGSTFKGFVYAAAVATGKNPLDGYLDAPIVIDGYEPKNYDEGFRGWINMSDALTKSINIVAVRVLMKVGYQPTIDLAHKMGIKSEIKPVISMALGSNEVNLLELTSAYGTFANKGMHVEPHAITRVLNRNGEVVWSADFKGKRALDADSAAITTWMLQNVVTSGTATRAQIDRPVAGKTGTTDEARDLWFVGFIPQLVTGVWLGNDNNQPTYGDSTTAAYTWRQFMKEATDGMPVEKFPQRPKLDGRKGTIKAEPIKPRRFVTKAVPSKADDSDDSEDDSENTTRRNSSRRRTTRRTNTNTSDSSNTQTRTRSRRRRSTSQTQEESTTPTRRRRSVSSGSLRESSSGSSGSSRSQRRRRSTEPTTPRRSRSSSSPQKQRSSSPPKRKQPSAPAVQKSAPTSGSSSWRERLKPASSE
ncbi:penicillin-binding protein 1A [Rivularia sp. UHCC 0363]|uniref:transglycosylase domain-containing protein n=1 Tax=Rivularia sp. UHCC 0363 TaxID=3110244 RepID=UPI002B211168|nr:penicillin-binding protein 1A [Rivularia sp. UHCC 0363]MEA5592898.1 penicillin-binding protein 1A [Rivularia sp. UHCC 0363]